MPSSIATESEYSRQSGPNRIDSIFPGMLYLLLLSTLLYLTGCASGEGIPPPGGPPDKTPPTIVESTPPDGTTNFTGDEIEIQFNERLNESGAFDQVIVMPIPENPPTIEARGKTLRVKFRGDLLPDRTYAVTVGAGVQDLSGNRLGTPLTIRFSTGSVIDSGRIAGFISGLERRTGFVYAWQIPTGNATFGDTLNPELTPPDFIAPVADNGRFSIEALPPGTYRLAAIADAFGDREYAPENDAIGIAPADITVTPGESVESGLSIRIASAPKDRTPPRIVAVNPISRTSTSISFSEDIDSSSLAGSQITISAGGTNANVTSRWVATETKSVVQFAHSALPVDVEGVVEVRGFRDTNGIEVADSGRSRTFTTTDRIDTTAPRFITPPNMELGIRLIDTLRIGFDEGVVYTGDPTDLSGSSNSPVVGVDTATGTRIAYNLVRRSASQFVAFTLDTNARPTAISFEIDLQRFADGAGNRGDSVERYLLPFRPRPQRGTLTGRLIDSTAPNVPHIILLQASDDIWTYRIRLKGSGEWSIKNIPAGQYQLSAFRDTDNDGEYDYGSFTPFRPAEVYREIEGGIRVRPRWTTTDVDIRFP